MDKLLLALRALGPARILSLFIGLAAVVAMLGMVAGNLSKPGMTLLYGGLSAEEAATMSTWLDGRGVAYEAREDGSIYVPSTEVGQLRLQAAGQGLVGPSNSGYEIFDKSSGFGTTSFVQNINARRALEGELARTITSLPAVGSARVHLVLPQRRLFDREGTQPSAAVALSLNGRILGEGQVENVARLVASSVPNLTIENVTVIDQAGNMLFNGKEANGVGAMGSSRLQNSIEQNYTRSITNMLERVVGAGKVSVKVTIKLNRERVEEQSELFDPRQQVVRSEQRVEDSGDSNSSSSSGVVGLTGNIPQEDAGLSGGGNSTTESKARVEETINYEISRTLRNRVKEGGDIERISVAVLMEGKYITSEDNEAGAPEYQAYTQDELARFKTLVQTAIGYNADRGDTVEIIDMPFSPAAELEETPVPFLSKSDIFMLIQYGVLFLGLLLVIFMVIKPALGTFNKAVQTILPPPQVIHAPGASGSAPMPATAGGGGGGPGPAGGEGEEAGIAMNRVQGRVRESVIKQVNEVIDQHPEESLTVVRTWMADSDKPKPSSEGDA